MVTIKWDEIDACQTCFALVPRQVGDFHRDWHSNIASEAIRSSGRLDVIEQAGQHAQLGMIYVQPTWGGLLLQCTRCGWAAQRLDVSAANRASLAELVSSAVDHRCVPVPK